MDNSFVQLLADAPVSVRVLTMLGILSAIANLVGWTCCAVTTWVRNRPRARGPDGRFKPKPLSRPRRPAKDAMPDLTEDDI